jgi:hypothetical protein
MGLLKYLIAIASPVSTNDVGSSSPWLMSKGVVRLSLTNSGLTGGSSGSPEGIRGSLNAGGSFRTSGLWGSL